MFPSAITTMDLGLTEKQPNPKATIDRGLDFGIAIDLSIARTELPEFPRLDIEPIRGSLMDQCRTMPRDKN